MDQWDKRAQLELLRRGGANEVVVAKTPNFKKWQARPPA
jgi:hypothetical protein